MEQDTDMKYRNTKWILICRNQLSDDQTVYLKNTSKVKKI